MCVCVVCVCPISACVLFVRCCVLLSGLSFLCWRLFVGVCDFVFNVVVCRVCGLLCDGVWLVAFLRVCCVGVCAVLVRVVCAFMCAVVFVINFSVCACVCGCLTVFVCFVWFTV